VDISPFRTEDIPSDGRAARSHRTRRAIVEAMRTLHSEGDLRPRASLIAERAGVSQRTVWQQFADTEALLVEASRRDLEILMTMLWAIDVGLPLDKRITQFVSRNAHIYERMAPGWRAARLHEPFSAELRRSKQRMNALGKAEIEAVFAPELLLLVGQRRIQLTSALAGVGFWQFWESLRTDVGASPEQAQDIVASLFTASLTLSRASKDTGLRGASRVAAGALAAGVVINVPERSAFHVRKSKSMALLPPPGSLDRYCVPFGSY
jgi:TetR/AcrR family transcriptional regulator, regulator of autoinduction and epiphytic fitness